MKQQSISRMLRRGNAVLYFDNVTKKPEIQQKRGATRVWYSKCLRNSLSEATNEFVNYITKPITKAMMDAAKEKGDRIIVNSAVR